MEITRISDFDWELQRMLELVLAVRRQRGERITMNELLSQYRQQKQFHDNQRQRTQVSEPLLSMVFKSTACSR